MATVQRKTPGVYISEPDSFPPAIVGVETAIPAFIGFTEIAQDKSKSLKRVPTRIRSMAEYISKFGRWFQETFYLTTEDVPASDHSIARITLFPGAKSYNLAEEGKLNFNLYNSLQLFYANGGGTCYIVSCDTYEGLRADPSQATDSLKAGLDAVRDEMGPTMLVVPDAMLLNKDTDAYEVAVYMLQQCQAKQDRVALLDVYGTSAVPATDNTTELEATITAFRVGLAGAQQEALRYGIAYFPNLQTSMVSPGEVKIDCFGTGDKPKALKEALAASVDAAYPAGDPRAARIKDYIDQIGLSIADTDDTKITPLSKRKITHGELTQALLANVPALGDIFHHVANTQNILPPSPAMAGIYTAVDSSRGVWNAPANVGIALLVEPTATISDKQQEDLNVPTGGKAVNAIRTFPSRGPLVWGARTLDSTSNDWKYIQVRRTMIYVEQSIKTALNSFVFAPNTATTWTTVVSMIGSFLHGLWASGGLMGSTPAEAYSVKCGLGSTMTPDDVLNGTMTVHVVVQMVHPAEFIELVFKQQMLGGAA
jgi:phage tail sheath protein FI